MSDQPTPTRTMRKKRTVNSLWLLLLLGAALGMYRYSDDLLRWVDPQAASLGVEVLQPAIVAMIYVLVGVVFSTMMAAFMENQLRENSLGSWSRFATTFTLSFLGYCFIAAALL